ncbi:hypothetical protein CASFOL_002198 [Castilleja foliolosa]|uniref:FBD domain-containing protein n=1 Tax=Castilleja foliolosa TaxID=1961234 RepID=A0ABD3EDV3_9LAMI
MEKTQETSRKQIIPSSVDRLSAFPDDVLCHILSFLPTKTSVSTSILAQRWKLLWAHVPNIIFGHDRGSIIPEIDIIYNKVFLRYRVKNMNTLRLFSNHDSTQSSKLSACIQDAVNRNVKEMHLFFSISYTFPRCILNCKTLVYLRLSGYGYITLMTVDDDDVWLPCLKKLFLDSVAFECEGTLSYLLSNCPVLDELIINRSYPDVDCFIVSSRTINRLILDSPFYGFFNVNNRFMVKIDAPELRYLKVYDFAAKDVTVGSLTSLVEADVNFKGGENDDFDYHVDASVEDDANDVSNDDNDSVEDDANDVSDDDDDDDVSDDDDDDDDDVSDDDDDDDDDDVSDDDDDVSDDDDFPDNNALNDEAPPLGRDVLYARSVLEFVGGLCNVKYLRLSTKWMNVSDSEFSVWAANYNNLIKLEFRGDWRFIPNFLQTADNLQVLRICTADTCYKHWIEPNQVPQCLSTHLRTVRFDHFEIAEAEMNIIEYILRNAKVLKRMEIHSKGYGIDLEKKSEALDLISSFKQGSVECTLDFH